MRKRILLGFLLGIVGCGDGSSTGPGASPPVLLSLAPAEAGPLASPVVMTLSGQDLDGVHLQGPPFLFLEILERTDRRVQARVGFKGGPPGEVWIRVSNTSGRDSLPFSIQPLAVSDSLSETRALWMSRFEYGSVSDIEEAVERAGTAGFNLLYLQVRGRADAFYHSELEPWAARLSGVLGQDPGWDPLAVAVEAGSRHGVEVHAWINAFTGWAGSMPPPPSVPLHAFLEHPDWAMVDEGGTVMPYQSGTRWMTPGHPEVRTRLARVAADIARRYDVGGVHLDFIRYPSTGYSFDLPSLAAYDSARVLEPGLGFDEMRRRFVTQAVEEVRDSLRLAKADARLSAAVWGIYKNFLGWSGVSTGFGSVLQDARAWDRLGLVDALAPMVYWPMTPVYGDRLDFAYLADEHSAAVDAPVFVGLLAADLTGAEVAQHIERARMAGAEGVSVFSYSALEGGGLWDELQSWAFFWPARRVH